MEVGLYLSGCTHLLTSIDGAIFYGSRFVIPNSLREVLEDLHQAHQE